MTDSKDKNTEANLEQRQTVDELLKIIRGEAKYLQEQEGSFVAPGFEANTNTLPLPVLDIELDPFPIKTAYHCNEFLIYDDLDFVINAYRGILQREPDESGLDRYTALLRSKGEQSKYEILIALLNCEEGKQKKVRVNGMRWEVWERNFAGKRWFFYPLQVLFSALKARIKNDQQGYALENMRKARNWQRKLKQFLEQQQKQLVYIDSREREIENSQGHIDVQLKNYRKELLSARQDMLLQQQRLNVLLDDIANQAENPQGNNKSQNLKLKAELATHASEKLDAFYLAFENECRGSEDDIRQQLAFYVDVVTNNNALKEKPLLDIGSGRGEWLGLLKQSGITASGVDISKVLVDHCKKENLHVVLADGIEHLRELPDQSLGAVSAFHVIEHLPFNSLFTLVEQAHRVIAPGGQLIFETPNPENILVASHTFYHDPTHRNLITPTLIDFLVRYLGFIDVRVERLHPYPDEARVIGIDTLTERVNGHLCGPQDFAVIATKPNN